MFFLISMLEIFLVVITTLLIIAFTTVAERKTIIFFLYNCFILGLVLIHFLYTKLHYDVINPYKLWVYYVLFIYALIYHLYSIYFNYINKTINDKFYQTLLLVLKNPIVYIYIFIIGIIIRFFFRYYIYYNIGFIFIYITMPHIKLLSIFILYSIKHGLKKNYFYSCLKLSIKNYHNHVTISIIYYYLWLFLLDIQPFIIKFQWSYVNWENLGKFFIINKYSLIKAGWLNINFEPFWIEMVKLIPNVNISYKIFDLSLSEQITISRNNNIYNYPSDQLFRYPDTRLRVRNLSQFIDYTPGTTITVPMFYTVSNITYHDLLTFRKIDQPYIAQPEFINELEVMKNTRGTLNNSTFRTNSIIRSEDFANCFLLPDKIKSLVTQESRWKIDGTAYNFSDNRPFLHLFVNLSDNTRIYKKDISFFKDFLVNDNTLSKNLYNPNRFVIWVWGEAISFFIYQENFVRDNFPLKGQLNKSLTCIALGKKGVIPVSQTDNAELNIMPYRMDTDANSILVMMRFLGICKEVPSLNYQRDRRNGPDIEMIYQSPILKSIVINNRLSINDRGNYIDNTMKIENILNPKE